MSGDFDPREYATRERHDGFTTRRTNSWSSDRTMTWPHLATSRTTTTRASTTMGARNVTVNIGIARKDDIAGFAVASDERIEAYVLCVKRETEETEIVSLRCFIDDGGARLKQLLSRLCAQGIRSLWFPTVHPAEISKALVETLGFSPAGWHLLYAARAQSA